MGRWLFWRYLSPTYLRLYGRLFSDKRTPLPAKLLTVAALAYVASPLDLIPDWLLGLGWLDDIGVMALALINLVKSAPPEVVREHLNTITAGKKP